MQSSDTMTGFIDPSDAAPPAEREDPSRDPARYPDPPSAFAYPAPDSDDPAGITASANASNCLYDPVDGEEPGHPPPEYELASAAERAADAGDYNVAAPAREEGDRTTSTDSPAMYGMPDQRAYDSRYAPSSRSKAASFPYPDV